MQVELKEVIKLLDEKGYNPSEQLKGYIILGNDKYITRHRNARELVKKINKSDIIDYLRGLNI